MSKAAPIPYPGESVSIEDGAPAISVLDDECRVYAYYLIGQEPNRYVLSKYREANLSDAFTRQHMSRWDRFLLTVSSRHSLLTRLVDCYTAVFFRKSIVRRKWILLLAILENCSPTFRYFESPEVTGKWSFVVRMFVKGAAFVVALCVACALFLPFQLGFALHSRLFGRAS